MDLNIEWVDNEAWWGDSLKLIIKESIGKWFYRVSAVRPYGDYEPKEIVLQAGEHQTQELAEQACEKALRKIITGVKEND